MCVGEVPWTATDASLVCVRNVLIHSCLGFVVKFMSKIGHLEICTFQMAN